MHQPAKGNGSHEGFCDQGNCHPICQADNTLGEQTTILHTWRILLLHVLPLADGHSC